MTFDLIGLPPTPEEVDAFLADDSPDAFAQGRRPAARLAALRRALGAALARRGPVRRVERQDELHVSPGLAISRLGDRRRSTPTSRTTSSSASRSPATCCRPTTTASGPSRSIATGFLAIGSKAHDTQNRGQFVLDLVDEQIEATTQAFLGLTVACARCHDHKFDPISQRDYYALSGIFRSTQTCSGTLPGVFPNFNPSPLIELPAGAGVPSAVPTLTPGQRAAMEERLAALVRERDAIPPGEANRDRLRRANSMLAMLRFRLAHRPARRHAAHLRDGRPRARSRPSTARSTSAASSTSPARSSLAGSSRCSAPRRPRRSRRGAAGASWPTGSPRPRTR